MIVVDSSAVVAILLDELEATVLSSRLALDAECVISAANYLDTGTVLAGRHRSDPASAQRHLDAFLEAADIVIAPVDATQARLALHARVKFGRGLGASGTLNFGDCFAYALAKSLDAPLLYLGKDFARTGIAAALGED